MRQMVDYAGQRYGMLTALSFDHSASKNAYYWKFMCDCGKETITNLHDVRRGKIQSCGCIKRKLSDEELGFRRILYNYKKNAAQHDRAWNIPVAEFRKLIKQSCYYCGEQPSNNMLRWQSSIRKVEFSYNGLDRIDSARGYELDNVVSCCGVCNKMKLDTDQKNFIERIHRISSRFREV